MVDNDENRLNKIVYHLKNRTGVEIEIYNKDKTEKSKTQKIQGYRKISGVSAEELKNKDRRGDGKFLNRQDRKPINKNSCYTNLRIQLDTLKKLHAVAKHYDCSITYAIKLALHFDANGKIDKINPKLKGKYRSNVAIPDSSIKVKYVNIILDEHEKDYLDNLLKTKGSTTRNVINRIVANYLKAYPNIEV
ncbi:MAG: hypothetical protein LRZ84_14315 [Desertifilum sp.]|nr:hypothetical protein [Desertifilum sp.]